MKWLRNWAVIAAGCLIAAHTHEDISFNSYWTLLGVVLIISALNALLRPVLIFFTLPFIIVTMGVGLVFINALLVKLTGALVNGFEVASWWSAIWAAIIIGMTSFFANLILGDNKAKVKVRVKQGGKRRSGRMRRTHSAVTQEDDVIDI